MSILTLLALLTFGGTATKEEPATSTKDRTTEDAGTTASTDATTGTSDPTGKTREPDGGTTGGPGDVTAPPPDGLPPKDPTLPLAEQPPPPITLVGVLPVDDEGRGLIERVSPRFAHDDVTWLGNLDLTFEHTGYHPVEITSVDLTWVGTGQGTDTWSLPDLVDTDDSMKTFLDGADFHEWGTRSLPEVTGAMWGFWADALRDTLDDDVFVSGTAFDGGSRLVAARLSTWGTPLQETRLFAGRNAWSAGIERGLGTVFVGARVVEDDAWGSFALAEVDQEDFSAPTPFGEQRFRHDSCDVTGAWDTTTAGFYLKLDGWLGWEHKAMVAVAGTADCI
ncbi:MAG: hypothetical protein KC656_27900, partial [Myxococcales bacterium]|nr:hypothetical protein [Myxococcales bacterium]